MTQTSGGSGEFGSRDAYATAGAAQRQAIERATRHEPELKPGQLRTLFAVFALTASYSRLGDRVWVADVAARANVSDRHARATLKLLARAGIIDWRPSRGHGVKSYLGLPEQGETGRLGVPVSTAAALVKAERDDFRFDDAKPEQPDQESGTAEPDKPEVQECRLPRRDPEKKPRGEIVGKAAERPAYVDHCYACDARMPHDPTTNLCMGCGAK